MMRTILSSDQGLYSGLIRLHILHHACKEPVFGLGMIEELGRHGYRLSPGTLYPIMHGLEKRGLLRSKQQQVGGKIRRVYSATPVGRRALNSAKERVRELFGELFED
jgi:PadR family transcriptional regulator